MTEQDFKAIDDRINAATLILLAFTAFIWADHFSLLHANDLSEFGKNWTPVIYTVGFAIAGVLQALRAIAHFRRYFLGKGI